MLAKVDGRVVAVMDTKTKREGKPYRVVSVLQENEKTAEIVRVNLWNGQQAEKGKALSLAVSVRAYVSDRGGAMLSIDAH